MPLENPNELAEFIDKNAAPYYLAHAVRVISDYINQEYFKKDLIALRNSGMSEDTIKTAEKKLTDVFQSGVSRYFEIKFQPVDDYVPYGARFMGTRPVLLNDGKNSGRVQALIQYDSSFEEDPRQLRFLLAHELAHIYLRKIAKLYEDNDTRTIKPDDEEEIHAWILAFHLMKYKDQFYRDAVENYAHCCDQALMNSFLPMIEHAGAKSQVRRFFLGQERFICPRCKG